MQRQLLVWPSIALSTALCCAGRGHAVATALRLLPSPRRERAMSGIAIALLGFAADAGADRAALPDRALDAARRRGRLHRYLSGSVAFFGYMKTNPYHQFANYTLSVIPLFILMGALAERAGIATALFKAAERALGRFRGGLAMAVIGACTAFGAICGSSVATTATFGRAALPELEKYKYDGGFATGTIAVGGTLGILIPPSVILVVYAITTEQNIAKLFQAALIPGLLAALFYCITIAIVVRRNPALAPMSEKIEVERAPRSFWPMLVGAALLAGIAAQWWRGVHRVGQCADPRPSGRADHARRQDRHAGDHDRHRRGRRHLRRRLHADRGRCRRRHRHAAGRPRAAHARLARHRGGDPPDGRDLRHDLHHPARRRGVRRLPGAVAAADGRRPRRSAALGLSPYVVLIAMLAFYILLGAVMDELAMILLTLPVFFPVIQALDFGMPPDEVAIWFGILVLIVVGIGLTAPPIGLNVFVISAMARNVPITATYRGVLPFIVADIIRLALCVAFPALSLWLVRALN